MTDYLHRVFEQYGEDEQERLEFDLIRFMLHERYTPLGQLFEYYKSLMRGNSLPRADEFSPTTKLNGLVLRTSAWVDTSAESPDNFIMRDHPPMLQGPFGVELSGTRLADFPSAIHADALIAEYNRCRRQRRPMYHEIDQTINGVSRAYRRLMLPLVNERGAVVRVGYAYRFLSEPELVGPAARSV